MKRILLTTLAAACLAASANALQITRTEITGEVLQIDDFRGGPSWMSEPMRLDVTLDVSGPGLLTPEQALFDPSFKIVRVSFTFETSIGSETKTSDRGEAFAAKQTWLGKAGLFVWGDELFSSGYTLGTDIGILDDLFFYQGNSNTDAFYYQNRVRASYLVPDGLETLSALSLGLLSLALARRRGSFWSCHR